MGLWKENKSAWNLYASSNKRYWYYYTNYATIKINTWLSCFLKAIVENIHKQNISYICYFDLNNVTSLKSSENGSYVNTWTSLT